jgi:hypothetical protein
MFENRITIGSALGAPAINTALLAAAQGQLPTNRVPQSVQLADIYQAAKTRAIEDYELDKLFNAAYYDYEI